MTDEEIQQMIQKELYESGLEYWLDVKTGVRKEADNPKIVPPVSHKKLSALGDDTDEVKRFVEDDPAPEIQNSEDK